LSLGGYGLERLRYIREQAGYSQQDLADESGVSQHTISEIELGRRRPQGRTLRKLAKILNVDVRELLDRELLEVAVGVTPEEAAEEFEQQLYAPARIAQDWRRLAQRWEKRLEKGDFEAHSLEDFIDTLEDVALSMQASVAAERRELMAQYGEDVARNRAVLRPALDRLSTLVGDALRKIDAKELEAEAELAGKLARLEDHLKRAS
jgi:transcriptional regulator with XRE-family HTH domain